MGAEQKTYFHIDKSKCIKCGKWAEDTRSKGNRRNREFI